MYKRKPIKTIALLLTFCLLMTAFSGTAIRVQAEELGIAAAQSTSSSQTFIFDHLYDSVTFSTKRTLYSNAVSFVDTVYERFFNISFTSKSAPVLDTVTYLTSCRADASTPCSNAFSCGTGSSHHRDVGRIANLLYSAHIRNNGAISASNKYITVLWTDYDGAYCYNRYNDLESVYEHELYNAYAVVFDHKPVIHILSLGATASQHSAHMALLLAHETAHCFGAEDEYNNERPAEHCLDGVWNCLVDSFEPGSVDFYNSVRNGTVNAFCSACTSAIESGIDYWPNTAI